MILVLIVLAALWTPVTQTIDRYEAAQTLVVPAHVENAFLIAKPSRKPGPAWMFPRPTLRRRLTLAACDYAVNARYDEREQLRLYLSEIYLGQNGREQLIGLPAASRHFFNKDVSQLTLDEGVLLAAIHVSPNVFNPIHHPERAFARRDQLLRAMLDARMISKRDLDAALGQRTIPR